MSVLRLSGKKINWAKPPKPTTRVMWSQKTTGGKQITGSLRTIAHLDRLNNLAKAKFGRGLIVFQGPFNTGVVASAGTHDYDACLDVWIPGVSGERQRRFFRSNGAGGWWRKPPTFGSHIHYFTLPPRQGSGVDNDFKMAGFKVGKFVDGGWSLYGRQSYSSQIGDYYGHRTGLSGHYHESTWFPPNIEKTIFDLDAYIARRVPKVDKPKPKKKKTVKAIAKEVIAGKWGQGNVRARKLKQAGYNPNQIQRRVNTLLAAKKAKPKKKSINRVAREVVAGKWGNGPARTRRLKAAGYNPKRVQRQVNKLL